MTFFEPTIKLNPARLLQNRPERAIVILKCLAVSLLLPAQRQSGQSSTRPSSFAENGECCEEVAPN
jgi:hypothetical protein